MIEESFARDQVRRLSVLSFFPSDRVPVKELVVALRDVAKDESTAVSVVDDLLASVTECPKPAEIRRAAHAKNTAVSKMYEIQPTRCTHCSDSGYRRDIREIKGVKYEFAVKCECSGGA